MDFGALALVIGAGLLGPLLASTRRLTATIVVGELLAGVLIGTSGLQWVDATSPTLDGLSQIGFALLMLIAGTHLPLRTTGLTTVMLRGAFAVLASGVLAVGAALVIRAVTGFDHLAVLILLLTTSSAAIIMPILADRSAAAGGPPVLIAWVVLADVLTVIGVSFVFTSERPGTVVFGTALTVALAGVLYLLIKVAQRRSLLDRREEIALRHGWGLRLRLSVFALCVLSWVATHFGASVLIAGFSLGFVLALVGQPDSLASELIGVGEGFLVPIFFVTLGARLDVRALLTDSGTLLLLASLLVAVVVIHVAVSALLRSGVAAGLIASAQLGVPAAVATLGLSTGDIVPGEAAAIVTAAIASVGISALGVARLRNDDRSRHVVGDPGLMGGGGQHDEFSADQR